MNSKKYNIGIIANPVSDEGKNIYLKKFINILKPLSNEIFVINGDFPESFDRKVHIIRIKADLKKESSLIRSIKFLLVQMRLFFNLAKISKNIDIVIFFGSSMTVPIFFAKLMGKRTIVMTGGLASKSEQIYSKRLLGLGRFIFPCILRFLEKISFTLSDQITADSESLIKFLGLAGYKDKILITNKYLDLNKFKINKDLKDKKYLIGFISRLNEGKGIMNFLNAIPLILNENENIEFLIGGDGPLLDEIQTKLSNNELYNKVEITGWISHDELPYYLNELRLLIFPSYSEGLPNIVSESMACGTIVLATPVGGVPDLIKDGITGFVMKENSPECIAKNVLRALNYSNSDKIVINARKLIEEKYSYNVSVESWRKILYSN